MNGLFDVLAQDGTIYTAAVGSDGRWYAAPNIDVTGGLYLGVRVIDQNAHPVKRNGCDCYRQGDDIYLFDGTHLHKQ